MGIFDIFVRKDKKSKKHFSQNGKNTEEAMLKKTAKSAPNPQERMQAVSEITDQDFLNQNAKKQRRRIRVYQNCHIRQR